MLVCASKRPASTACFNSRSVGTGGARGAEGANAPLTQILAGIEINLLIHRAWITVAPSRFLDLPTALHSDAWLADG